LADQRPILLQSETPVPGSCSIVQFAFARKRDRTPSGRLCRSLTNIETARPVGSRQKRTLGTPNRVCWNRWKKPVRSLDSLLSMRHSLLRQLCARTLKTQTIPSRTTRIATTRARAVVARNGKDATEPDAHRAAYPASARITRENGW